MNILLTGSTGYIGKRLLSTLLDDGHKITCAVRSVHKFDRHSVSKEWEHNLNVVECDFCDQSSLSALPSDIDVAYYLIHSMSTVGDNFADNETRSASHFVQFISTTTARQIVYLSGITNDNDGLSSHLSSRRNVETVLRTGKVPVTVLRAAIVIGSGSASFEIIRDLVEKLPIMVAPKWLRTRCQPIAIRNVIQYLVGVINSDQCINQSFDIGGPDVLTYQEMLQQYAQERGLKRVIFQVGVLTPRLSSLWLALVTTTSYPLARRLVDSLKNEVVCADDQITRLITVERITYRKALQMAFDKISHKNVISSWRDSANSSRFDTRTLSNVQVPTFGVSTDIQTTAFTRPISEVIKNIWSLGGHNGWQSARWMWQARGVMDKLVGGVGLGRGRRDDRLITGDAVDFWRVLLADQEKGRLVLYAEMKIPGEAWLEFVINPEGDHHVLTQTATFRPLGLSGRLYWIAMLPFHFFIFRTMINNLVTK